MSQSWLVSLATVLDTCALLIAGSDGLIAAQAGITYRMGLRLLNDLTGALCVEVDPQCQSRLNEGDLPALWAALVGSGLSLSLSPGASRELLRLVGRYGIYLSALSALLMIPLPSWNPTTEDDQAAYAIEEL